MSVALMTPARITRVISSTLCWEVAKMRSMQDYLLLVDTYAGAYCLDAPSLIPTGSASNHAGTYFLREGDN